MGFRNVAARAVAGSAFRACAGGCLAVIPAILLAGAVGAGPVQVIGFGPARVELVPTLRGYAVIYRNSMVKSLTIEKWTLDLPGITVAGVIAARDAALPDDLIVTPPPGWWCDPCAVTVEENDVGSVDLWPEVAA